MGQILLCMGASEWISARTHINITGWTNANRNDWQKPRKTTTQQTEQNVKRRKKINNNNELIRARTHSSNLTSHLLLHLVYSLVLTSSYARSLAYLPATTIAIQHNNKINIFLALFFHSISLARSLRDRRLFVCFHSCNALSTLKKQQISISIWRIGWWFRCVVFDAFMSIFLPMKNERLPIIVCTQVFCFRLPFRLQFPTKWESESCVYLFLCWFIRTATTLSTAIKQNHVHFVFLSFAHLVFECICTLYSKYIYIRHTEFHLTKPVHTFYLWFFLCALQGRESFLLVFAIRTRAYLNVRPVAAKSSNLIKRIFRIFLLLLFHSIFLEREHFDFYVTIVGRFWCRWVCN